MKTYAIDDKNFEIKKAIKEGQIHPTDVVDVTVWVHNTKLEIRLNKSLEDNGVLQEAVIFFWDYFGQKPLAIRKIEVKNSQLVLEADKNLLFQMQLLKLESVRIGIAFQFVDKYFCGYFRNIEAKDEELQLIDRSICKLASLNESAFVAYWTENGILSMMFRDEQKFDNGFYRAKLSGYYWEKGNLVSYIETPLMEGVAEISILSTSSNGRCENVIVVLEHIKDTGLRRIWKMNIDLSDIRSNDSDGCFPIVTLNGHTFRVFMDNETDDDALCKITLKSGETLDACVIKEKNDRFILKIGRIYPVMLSIVTAVYNTAPFLPEMINSVLSQDVSKLEKLCEDYRNDYYQNIFEFIFVDDDSADESFDIFDDYLMFADKFNVIHKENDGNHLLEKAGTDLVRGKYCFQFDVENKDIVNDIKLIDALLFFEKKYKFYNRYNKNTEISAFEYDLKNGFYLQVLKDKNCNFIELKEMPKLFSVVMAVYNVEPYIEDAINSLVSQDIGFEKNIQLILVDDGSTDNSGEICKKYRELYPNNILYIYKENGGQSSARNIGLKYVTGKYINFMDSDDTMTANTFSEVCKFIEQNNDAIDMVCIPLVYFEAHTGIHGKYAILGEKNKIINLVWEPHSFILSSASMFYKGTAIDGLTFDECLIAEEDTKFNLSVIQRTHKIGYVCENGVKYNYRKRLVGGSNVDILSTGENIETLLAPIYIFEDLFDYSKELAPYQKEIIIYELRSRLQIIKKEALSEADYARVISAYKKWISKIGMTFISYSKWLETIEKKVLFLQLSGCGFGEFVRSGYSSLSDRLMYTLLIEYKNGEVKIVCRFNNFNDSDIELVLISKNHPELIIYPEKYVDIDGPYNLVIGNFNVDQTHIRYFSLMLTNDEYFFAFLDKKKNYIERVRRNNIFNKNRCAANLRGVGPVYEDFVVSVFNAQVLISNNKNLLNNMTDNLEKRVGHKLNERKLKKTERFILISDRPEKAGDNGEALFNYIMENECEDLKDNTFFVISKKCDDYKRMKYKTHIIDFQSYEHLDKFLNAKIIYSSHNAVRFIYPFDISKYNCYADLLKYKFVWLQHGVTKDDIAKEANKLNTLDDAVITTTKWEYGEFLKSMYLYEKEDIILSGFARFDNLIDKKEKKIIVAPTWRTDLVGGILNTGHNEPKVGFETSDFYKYYVQFLTDSRLQNLLDNMGYHLQFVLHSGFTCYEPLFESIIEKIDDRNIEFVDMNKFSYQEAFCTSSLFITDYSSTAFDFAYLRKPVIYFQFDEDMFFEKHYHKSDWSYRQNGFGSVVKTVDELIDEIERCFNNNCILEEKYLERINKTFVYFDHNNCKRIMDATRKWI